MKYILSLFFFFIVSNTAFAVCLSPITRTPVGASSVLTATKYNSDVNTAYGRANNLPGDCIIDSSITTSKLANGAVTTPKLANGSITSEKLAPDALPGIGRILRISAFTTSGTWTKNADVGFVYIQVVGGGGAGYAATGGTGGTSSFGPHCTANGGAKATSVSGSVSYGGAGGTASGGDINLTGGVGGNGFLGNSSTRGGVGVSLIGGYGRGGFSIANGGGGGGGGYCAKLIQASALNATETVTIGASGGDYYATAGIVFVYEYSK